MTFTPKFVDLVRNLTSVQGTGPVVLGSAVSGYSGLAQSLQAGDQFYYCIQGVDKPQEREVGRGTLQSDGRITRESVSGGLTNFSSGTKTIALVAAAEWFSKLESAGNGNAKSPFVTPQQFGAKGDGTSNDGPAFAAAIDFLKTNAVNDLSIYKGSPRLFVPAGHYFMGTTTLEITHTLIIEGEGTGQAGGAASKLRWAANTTGIRVQRANTSGVSSVDTELHYGGDATILQNLLLMGAFTTAASEGPYHAVHAKARVLVRDCFIQYWQGNGINIVATSGGGTLEGNANQFAIERITCWYCQNGIYIDGADANAGYTLGCDVSYCRQWGLWDSSFLGNNHSNHHSANCGFADNGLSSGPFCPPSIVSHNGHIYYVKVGQEEWCSANAPSGSTAGNQGWLYLRDGGPFGASIPAWVSGATYRTGGPYRVGEPDPANDGNQSLVISGCYAEGGSAPPQFGGSGTLLLGGIWGTGIGGYAGYIAGNGNGVNVGKALSVGQNLFVNGQTYLGTTLGAGDNNIYLQSCSGFNWLNFQTYDGAGALTSDDGYLFGEQNIGLVLNGKSNGSAIRFRANGAAVATIRSAGFDLASGKVLLVDGTQVVGAQQEAIANHASDPTVNAVLGALRSHGLIAA
jgi:hypothetical protein